EGSHDSIYTTNKSGQILDMNPAGVDLLGYSSKEALVSSITAQDLYLNSDDRRKFLAKIDEVGFVKDYEVDFKTRQGSPLHVLISSRRYENTETGDIEYEGIIKDITHRKKTEEMVKERNRELSILNSVAVALNNTLDLDHILTVTLIDVLKALRLDRGALFLVDREEKKAVLQVRFGLPVPDPEIPNAVFFKDSQLERHLILDRARVTPQPTFPAFQVNYQTNTGEMGPWLTCFLITFKGRGVGFFGLDVPESRRLNKHEVHLLGSLGNFLGGTIENTRLMRTVRQHRQDLRRLTEKLFQSQEEERRRIARELHDEAGQSLTAVKLGLDRLEENHTGNNVQLKEEIDEIRQMIERTSSEIRGLSYRLHPTLLIDLGLEPALNRYFMDIERHSDLGIDFSIVGFDQRLSADMETVLYRFSQETLTNTLKHAKAKRFRLSIIKSYPRIIFLAEDNGIGFDTHIIGKDKRSLGLLGMRERASLLGGSFQLRSTPGEGTRIRIEIPLTEGAEM
ncbi:MAG: histidine kinase, partial [Desulfobacterales bacterium]|nr:histidine kinase [Desulfobacterales bacterium]